MKDKSKDAAPVSDNESELTKKIEQLLGPPPATAPAHETSPAPAASDPTATDSQNDNADVPADVLADSNESAETDKVVDEIIAKESDDLLAAEDKEVEAAFTPHKDGWRERIKNFFVQWWGNPKKRKATIIAALVMLGAALAVPPSRYFVMNTVGIRSSTTVTVLDDSTQLPLKNASVTVGRQSGQTDVDGKVTLKNIKLGSQEITVEKRAFATTKRKHVFGWGSNPIDQPIALTPVGTQYAFQVSDFLSGKPVKAEAISGEASALSNQDGKILLTVDKTDDKDFTVDIKAEHYREERVTLSATHKETVTLKMAPARKHVFVTRRSGKYDLYKIDADGKNEALVLAGTGRERDDMVVAAHPKKDVVALVSTRDNARNRDGFLLSTLTLINLADGQPVSVAQSERIQIVDWIEDKLIFVQIAAGTSAGNPQRHRLIAYDYEKSERKELAAANYFNDILIASGSIYYAPSVAYNTSNAKLFKINPDGSGKQTLVENEVWNIFRTAYDTLDLSVQGEWYQYKFGATKAAKSDPPVVQKGRIYYDSPDKEQSMWVDERDGKGVLLAYNLKDKTDKTIRTQSGLKNPVRWLSNTTLVYRINTDQETADYVLNLEGGEPQKIRDVTNTGGVDRWYYY